MKNNEVVLKLNVGSGKNKVPGYINLDVRPEVKPDIVHDLTQPLPYDKDVIIEIYCRHVLEHFNRHVAVKIVNDFYRVLKPKGVLKVIVPNLEFHAKQLLGTSKSRQRNQLEHAMAGFYGWETNKAGGPFSRHLWGYTTHTIRELLKIAGFHNLQLQTTEDWHLSIQGTK